MKVFVNGHAQAGGKRDAMAFAIARIACKRTCGSWVQEGTWIEGYKVFFNFIIEPEKFDALKELLRRSGMKHEFFEVSDVEEPGDAQQGGGPQ